MSRQGGQSSPALRVLWPLEGLRSITAGPKHRTAVILWVESADDFERRLLATGLAVRLAESGAELFAVVGKESEQAHDALDWVLEEAGAEDVITTWHDQDHPGDVASLFVASARASGLTLVVAALDGSTEPGARVRDALAEAVYMDVGQQSSRGFPFDDLTDTPTRRLPTPSSSRPSLRRMRPVRAITGPTELSMVDGRAPRNARCWHTDSRRRCPGHCGRCRAGD